MALRTTYEPAHTIEPIHTGGAVALSDDGRILATCLGEDVLLTDFATGRRLARIEGDGDNVTTIALTPSASQLLVCSRSLSMRIYALHRSSATDISAELVRTLKPHSSPVVTSATDNTGSLLATGAADGTVKIWDIQGGYSTHSLHGHSGVISALHFFQTQENGSFSTNQKKRRRSEQEGNRSEMERNSVGFRLASGDEDGKVRVWDLVKRKCVTVLDSHASVVRGLDFESRGQLLLTASRDKTVMLWNASSWKLSKTIPVFEEVEAAGFVPSYRNCFYTGGRSGRLRLWWTSGSEATEEQDASIEGHDIVHISSPTKQTFLLSVHADQNLLVHSLAALDAEPGSKVPPLSVERRISGTHDEIIDLAYVGGDGKHLAVATNLEDLKVISLTTSDPGEGESDLFFGADVGVLQGHEDIIICLDVDWSGNWLATGAKDNTAKLWRIDTHSASYDCHATLTGHAESIGAVAIPKQRPPEGSQAFKSPLENPPPYVLTGSQDKTIKRWDINNLKSAGSSKSQRASYTRKAHDKDINALDVNHDSSLFLSASQDRTVKIWSFGDGEAIGVLRGHKRGVWSAKFAPSNTSISTSGGMPGPKARGYVVTGSGDKTVKIWNVGDLSCLRTFEGHTNTVLKVLWMNSVAQTPPIQDIVDDESEQQPQGRLPIKGTKTNVQVASAGSDGLVKIWDLSTAECACTLDNHTDRVWALALNPNPLPTSIASSLSAESHTLVSGSADATITLWANTTAQTSHVASVAQNERIEQDQALQNYIRSRSYRPAILLALKLNHPARLLALFTEVSKTWPKEEGSLTGVAEVDSVLAGLSDEELLALLGRCREWNANAKTAPVAQTILWTLLKSYPAAKFTNLKSDTQIGKTAFNSGHKIDVKETLDALRVYTVRHYKRMEDLVDESFLVEYTLREMDEVIGTAPLPMANGSKVSGAAMESKRIQEELDDDTLMTG